MQQNKRQLNGEFRIRSLRALRSHGVGRSSLERLIISFRRPTLDWCLTITMAQNCSPRGRLLRQQEPAQSTQPLVGMAS